MQRSRQVSKLEQERNESVTAHKKEWDVKQFLTQIKRNGSFQQFEEEQLSPVVKQMQAQKNQTTYDILAQIYELQNRKNRNQSLLDELMRKTKQANDSITFQRIFQRKRYVKRANRCSSVAVKDIELEEIKGQLIQVRAIIKQPKEVIFSTPTSEKPEKVTLKPSLPSLSVSPSKKRTIPKRLLFDDLRFWNDSFYKVIAAPSYLELQQILNFTNSLQVVQNQKYYKIYVGRGNNDLQIKGMFSLRQWTRANSLDEPDINFIWTQKLVDLEPCPITYEDKEIISEEVDGYLDSTDTDLLKIVWDKIERKSKKTIQDYNLESAPLLTNLQLYKPLTIINHQTQHICIHNHLKDGNQLGDKKNLFVNLKQYCEEWDINLWSLIPETYHVHSLSHQSYLPFLEKYQQISRDESFKNIWIVKPGEDTNRGNGIKVSNQLQEINNHIAQGGHTFIVQKYLEEPLLYYKRKFDIRTYCLITIINGIKKAFWYKKGYIRTSSSQYSLDNLESQKIHLTNDAIQNKMNGYGKFEKGNKVSYEQFQAYIAEQNKVNNTSYNFDDLYAQMKVSSNNIKSITKIAIKSSINKIENRDQFVGFELYGMDYMVTNDFRPILIEFNTNPCIETGCPILAKVITNLLENLMRLVIDPIFPQKPKFIDEFNSKNNFELILQQACS